MTNNSNYAISPRLPAASKWKIEETYDYCDESSKNLFYKRREVAIWTKPKNMLGKPVIDEKTGKQVKRYIQQWWRTLDGKKPPGARRLIFRLPEVLKAIAEQKTIYIVEGEPKVEVLRAWGLCATCAPDGAGKWYAEHAELLRGAKRVVILPDNDDPGRKHSDKVGRSLEGMYHQKMELIDRRLLELPNLPEHGDIVDWAKAGGTKEQFLELAEAAREWKAYSAYAEDGFSTPLAFIDSSGWREDNVPELEYVVQDCIPTQQVTLFSGEGGYGKSLLQMQLSFATVIGREWLGRMPKQGAAIFLDAEDPPGIMHRRCVDIARYYGVPFDDVKPNLHLITRIGDDGVLAAYSHRKGRIEPTRRYHELLEMAGDIKPGITGIASSANVFAGSEIDRQQVQQFIGLLTRIAMVAEGGVVLIAHPSLTGISMQTGISGSTQWHNAVRARMFLHGIKANGSQPPDKGLRQLEFMKNQYGPISQSITLRWQEGLFLPVGDGGSFDQATRHELAKHVFVTLLWRFIDEKRIASDRTGVNYAPKHFAEEKEAKDVTCSKEELENAMRELLRTKDIIVVNTGRPSHPRYELRPNPDKHQRPQADSHQHEIAF